MTGPNQTWWERDLLGVVSGKVFSFQAAHPGGNLAGRWRSPGVHVSEAGAFCERGCSRGMRRSPSQPFPSQRLAAIAAGSGRCAAGQPHAAAGEKFGELLLPPTLPPRLSPPRPGSASRERGLLPPFVPRGAVRSDWNAGLRSAAVAGWSGAFLPLPPLILEQGGRLAVDSFCFIWEWDAGWKLKKWP